MAIRNWFGRRVDDPDVVPDGPDKLAAYREGRRDERARVDDDGRDRPGATKAELNAAYDRGRHDERRRHRSSPLFGLLILILVVVGAGVLYLAVRNGSFSKGGAVIDNNVSAAAQKVQAPLHGVADKTGTALQSAGENIKDRAGSGQP